MTTRHVWKTTAALRGYAYVEGSESERRTDFWSALLIANEQRNAYGLRYNDYERYRYVSSAVDAVYGLSSAGSIVTTGRIVCVHRSR